MTSHELAKLLLTTPDYLIVCDAGTDPSALDEVSRVTVGVQTFFDVSGKLREEMAVKVE